MWTEASFPGYIPGQVSDDSLQCGIVDSRQVPQHILVPLNSGIYVGVLCTYKHSYSSESVEQYQIIDIEKWQ